MQTSDADDRRLLEEERINLSDKNSQPSLQGSNAELQAKQAKKKKVIKWSIIGGSIALAVILAIVLIVVLTKKNSGGNPDDPPGPGPTPPFSPHYNPYVNPGSTSTENSVYGFIIATDDYNGSLHSEALQSLYVGGEANDTHSYAINPRGIPTGINNEFSKNVSYYFGVVDYYTGYLRMGDAEKERFEIPQYVQETNNLNPTMRTDMLGFHLYGEPFGVEFRDNLNPENVLLTTKEQTLVFMDKYIQMDFKLPSQRLYGFGEREREFELGEGVWTMWAKDRPTGTSQGTTFYDNGTGGKQGPSVHPFVLIQTNNTGIYVGIYFKNSNAQSPMLKFNDDNQTSTLSYITTGGVVEIFFIMQGSAKKIIQVYHNIIGKPSLPPFWALGWGQASTAYKNLTQIQDVVAGYEKANIPLNTIYLDLHSLDDFTDFQINNKDFKDLSKFSFSLHDKKMQIVALVESGISADKTDNKYYKRAQELGVLIQSSINKDKFNGALTMKSQNTHDVYIDWLHPNASQLWSEGLLDYYNQVDFDGLWLDRNAPYGYCNGECPDADKQDEKRFLYDGQCLAEEDPYTGWFTSFPQQDKLSTYYLPFIPGYSTSGNLDTNTLSLNATHSTTNFTEYDVHNLFGLMMTETTYSYLTDPKGTYGKKDNKPFILTRNTFPSSGKYASHFVSSMRSWDSMKYSISSLMNFNMFGIPHTGTDVCGYYGTEYGEELCARWIQLATFYPVARINYQTVMNGEKGNEPYKLTGHWLDVARDSIHDRYQYLRFIYTCLFEANLVGGSCYDPLFFEFERNPNSYKKVDQTFLVGSALKVSPILTKGVNETFTSYFPSGKWVNLKNYREIIDGEGLFKLKNTTTVNVHLRPGALIPFQNNSDQTIRNTDQLLDRPISIIANRDVGKIATGSVYLDKGILADEMHQQDFEHYKISIQANTMQKFLNAGKHGSQKQYFDKLVLVDAEDLQDIDFACYFDTHFNITMMNVTYDSHNKALTIFNEQPVLFSKFKQINFGSSKNNELNLCDSKSFQYTVKSGQNIDLDKNETSFIVNHIAKTLPDLRVNISVTAANTVNVKWSFADLEQGTPFQIPAEIITPDAQSSPYKLSHYVNIVNRPYFQIEILSSNEAVVHTVNSILFDHLLNVYGSTCNTTSGDEFKGIFGLGERTTDRKTVFYDDGVYSLWAGDNGTPFDNGKPPGKGNYGMHPFYMYKNDKNVWVGVFTKLAAAQDWYVKNYRDIGQVETTMIAIGGIADLYFIVDTTPSAVVDGYMDIVGKPTLPPFWALGWHQSRWGYESTEDLLDVVKGYSEAKIPLDTMWSDIDYMDRYRDFTHDTDRYAELGKFVVGLHKKGMSYVPIIDAGIAIRQDYKTYTQGVEQDVFLKVRDEILVGAVWPKEAAFPDWWANNTAKWWGDQLSHLKFQVDFDGLWEDMNEATNFCSGFCTDSQMMRVPLKSQVKYTPTGKDLEYLGIPLNVKHQNGYKEFDTHSLFGTMEVKTTFDWFNKAVRPFILSRSSFAGMGKYGFVWLGDNWSTTQYMGSSVIGVMMMNMFGIPFTGADICGFAGDTNPELCARWHVVGSFQPFARNHNRIGQLLQEPYVFSNDIYVGTTTYTDIMKMAITNRYHLLNYYYTQLYQTHAFGNGPVYKPLFFEYPDDNNAYANQTDNVMIGDSLKLGVLSTTIGQNTSEFYFPSGLWCNVFNGTEKCFATKGEVQTRSTMAYDFYLHLKEGKIIPMCNATKYGSMNTKLMQQNPIDLHILGKNISYAKGAWTAQGTYFNDDSVPAKPTKGYFNYYKILAQQSISDAKNQIIVQVSQSDIASEYDVGYNVSAVNGNDFLGQIQFYNAKDFNSTYKYTPTVKFVNGTQTIIGKVTYLEDIDRLVYDTNGVQLCLTSVAMISLIFTS